MIDNRMIDNEIKDLERHLEHNNGLAKRQALRALDIIKCQRDEIEGLVVGQETLQKYIAKLNKELERANIKVENQEAVIEGLNEKLERANKQNESHLVAIEGLKSLVNSLSNA